MTQLQLFVSVVIIVENDELPARSTLEKLTKDLAARVTDYEIIFILNGTTGRSVEQLREWMSREGLPNLQMFELSDQVSEDQAAIAGLENALGDFIAIANPSVDSLDFIPSMLAPVSSGVEIVLASNAQKPPQSFRYRSSFWLFNLLCRRFVGVDLAREAPRFRLISKRVATYVLQRPHPSIAYRLLSMKSGFRRTMLTYQAPITGRRLRSVADGFRRGMHLLMLSSGTPMRIATSLALFGASANILYSVYVVAIALFKNSVAPGWVTLSLQQSGMFFLFSLVLFLMGENLSQIGLSELKSSNYYIANELTSAVLTRTQRLNVEDTTTSKEQAPGLSS